MDMSPCPYRIPEDCGTAFAMGIIGGGIFHGVKGWRLSPRGHRMQGVMHNIRMRAPTTGGGFAVWGGLFSTFDCSLQYFRKKEDALNPILSGGCTGAVLALRAGVRAAATNFVVGAMFLAGIEGAQMFFMKQMQKRQRAQEMEMVAHLKRSIPVPPIQMRDSYGVGSMDTMDDYVDDWEHAETL